MAAARKPTPDIMEELFGSSDPPSVEMTKSKVKSSRLAKPESPRVPEEPTVASDVAAASEPVVAPVVLKPADGQNAKEPLAKKRSVKKPKLSKLAQIGGEPEKSKATFYLSEESQQQLETITLDLKQVAGSNKSKISKSVIIEAALRAALSEYEEIGDDSRLIAEMVAMISGSQS